MSNSQSARRDDFLILIIGETIKAGGHPRWCVAKKSNLWHPAFRMDSKKP
jgi:hypothetical protein